jgi:hypothetical protein
MMLLIILLIACLAGMAACPLIAFVVGRRRYGAVIKARRTAVIIYYTVIVLSFIALAIAVKLQFAFSSGFAVKATNLLGSAAGIVLLGLTLTGPFVALDLLSVVEATASQANLCTRCGYNLTGNISGVCPECGMPTEATPRTVPKLRRRIMALPWRRVLPVWLLIVALVTGLLGYVRTTEAWICSECCLHQFRVLHQFGLPSNGPVLFELRGGMRKEWGKSPLTPLFDPRGECRHNWVCYGSSGEGLTGGWRGIGLDPSLNIVDSEPDFAQFVNDHPDVLSRIRSAVRQRDSIMDWLSDEYYDWKESLEEATPGD